MESKKIVVENISNGVKSEFTPEHWGKVKNDPYWSGVLREVEQPKKPQEVQALEEKQAQKTADKKQQTGNNTEK